MMADHKEKLAAVHDVDIDEHGVFKYILIQVRCGNLEKHVVRGYEWAEYHADILERVEPGMSALGMHVNCIGGGRIKHDSKAKTLLVYGYSMGFGRADHSITVAILKAMYPGYSSISFSNDGY